MIFRVYQNTATQPPVHFLSNLRGKQESMPKSSEKNPHFNSRKEKGKNPTLGITLNW